MKTTNKLNLIAAALFSALAFTSVRAADLTPAETKAIAEEGFIYGLPIVMNYAVMYEYSVDKNSGQYKAPFNQINNEARVFTYKDTAVITPNSDTPYSILWLDLRAEPIVLSVPAVDKARYFSVMLCDGNTFNYGYIGSRATGSDAGKTFDFKDLPLTHKIEIGLGMKDGEEKVEKYLATGQKDVNGWKIGSLFGDRQFYSGDWLKRAAAAKGGIYGNDAVEAVYPMAKTLADGEVLDGAKHEYTLTFSAGQLPPVNAFWSVTMYDGKTQLLIENPINRYLINTPMLPSMTKNADGSLTLYIQKDSPGADKEANWLPAPDGPIYLVMRLYWPKCEPPSILPPGEGTWKPPGIVIAK